MSSYTWFGTSILFLSTILIHTSPAIALTYPFYRSIQRSCSASSPSSELRVTHEYFHQNEPRNNDLWNSSTVQSRWSKFRNKRNENPLETRQMVNAVFITDVYIHIVVDSSSASSASPNYVTDVMIQSQFLYLQNAFASSSIGFRLVSVDRTVNDTWAMNIDEGIMKATLRKGNYSSLNLYYLSQFQPSLGQCTLPASGVTVATPAYLYVEDGCTIHSGTMPGGNYFGYNIGGTTVHEVGHWNGLLHTFADYTCDTSDFGDYVADTPQQMTSTNGCPVNKDSCPNSGVPAGYNGTSGQGPNPYGPQGYSGPDPVHNYMDYSSDACYTGFTSGQGARMLNMWQIYRQGR